MTVAWNQVMVLIIYLLKPTNADNKNTCYAAPCSPTSALLYRHTDVCKNKATKMLKNLNFLTIELGDLSKGTLFIRSRSLTGKCCSCLGFFFFLKKKVTCLCSRNYKDSPSEQTVRDLAALSGCVAQYD